MVDDRRRTRRARIASRLGFARVAELRAAIALDFREASWRQRVALLGVVLWLLYEWGPGNETVTPWLLAGIIEDNTGASVIPITAGIGFAFTLGQQLASGFTALAGFSMFDRTSTAAWSKLRGNGEVAPGEWSRLGWAGRSSVVFGLGTTAVALIQVMSTGQVGVRRHGKTIAASAVLCAVLVALIGGSAATLAYTGRRIRPLAGPTRFVVNVLESPLFWLGLLVVLAVIHAARRNNADDVASSATTGEQIGT